MFLLLLDYASSKFKKININYHCNTFVLLYGMYGLFGVQPKFKSDLTNRYPSVRKIPISSNGQAMKLTSQQNCYQSISMCCFLT